MLHHLATGKVTKLQTKLLIVPRVRGFPIFTPFSLSNFTIRLLPDTFARHDVSRTKRWQSVEREYWHTAGLKTILICYWASPTLPIHFAGNFLTQVRSLFFAVVLSLGGFVALVPNGSTNERGSFITQRSERLTFRGIYLYHTASHPYIDGTSNRSG